MDVSKLCVIGAGTMGTGIAQIAAQAGIPVSLIDTDAAALPRSQKRLEKSLQGGIEREKITAEEAETVRGLIAWSTELGPVAEADWVIEAVFEDASVKAEVLGRVGALAREGVPIATNTSTLPVRGLSSASGRPEQFLGMHFFNPPPAMKLVEVIPGEQTRLEVTAAAIALCERMGKTPLVSPDIPGFVVNRALASLFAAALDIWLQGGTPETIDSAIELGLSHKMGPLRTADLVGLDVMLAILRSLHRQTGEARFAPPAEFVAMVESGKLGAKSGKGFYTYGG